MVIERENTYTKLSGCSIPQSQLHVKPLSNPLLPFNSLIISETEHKYPPPKQEVTTSVINKQTNDLAETALPIWKIQANALKETGYAGDMVSSSKTSSFTLEELP